jgi:cytosine/adenosine deaminase-related metal-dependent hydrolase
MPHHTQTIAADLLIDLHEQEISDALLTISNGSIQVIATQPPHLPTGTLQFKRAVILPAFVNAHTHLELTHRAGQVPPTGDFANWLRRLMQLSIEKPPTREIIQSAVSQGVAESLRSGTAALADITAFPRWSRETLATCPLDIVSFGEVIAVGHRRHLLNERLAAALDDTGLSQRSHESAPASTQLHGGLSPHAPYTVEPQALDACVTAAEARDWPLSMHLSESAAEMEYASTAGGPLREFLREIGVWDEHIPPIGDSPIAWADAHRVLDRRTIIAHANFADNADIALLASRGATVAYCPRTHAAFDHPPHPFRKMLDAGVNVCLGTDSLATNPSLSILDEVRFLHRVHPDLDPRTALRLATLHGWTAFHRAGMSNRPPASSVEPESEVPPSGTVGPQDESPSILSPGQPATFVVLPWDRSVSGDPLTAILQDDREPLAVCIRGRMYDLCNEVRTIGG